MNGVSFDGRAARYDELRPVDDQWWEVFDALVRLGTLRGSRVLEVGCGTGRLSQALEERALARVWAIDAAPAMVEKARTLGVNARVGRAENLPFKAGWFDAVVARMAIHLLDRPTAFAEARRALAPAGRIVIATEDPATFDDLWFGELFPSLADIDRARFPSAERLSAELVAAGFAAPTVEHKAQERTITREHALEILRTKAYSTFELLPGDEYRDGLAQAERELPEAVTYRFGWIFAAAESMTSAA